MSYATRNTIIIAAFWLVLLAVGLYYTKGPLAAKLEDIQAEREKKTERLEELQRLQKDKTDLLTHLERLQSISMGEIGTLVSNESPGETFDYMLQHTKLNRADVSINLVHESQKSTPAFTSRVYDISGTASLQDFFDLLWYLENGPVFYNVLTIHVKRPDAALKLDEPSAAQFIDYSINVESYQRESGPDIQELDLDPMESEPLETIFFNPVTETVRRIESQTSKRSGQARPSAQPEQEPPAQTQPQPAERVSAQPEQQPTITLRQHQLIAMTHNSVILRGPDGQTRKVRKGEQYLNATLSVIDVQNNSAIFQLYENGRYNEITISE